MIVAIDGPAGAGKSRLALHMAADLVDDFGDGVWLAELAALQTFRPARIVGSGPVALGAIVEVEDGEQGRTFFLAPVGAGVETGMRETRVPLPAGSVACFFTDGLVEARVEGGLLGRKRLTEMVAELGEWDSAQDLLARLAENTQRATDDMAACIVRAAEGTPTSNARIEQLELRAGDDWSRPARSFLADAGVSDQARVDQLFHMARLRAAEFGAAILRVTVEGGETRAQVVEPDLRGVTVLPPPMQAGDASDSVAL